MIHCILRFCPELFPRCLPVMCHVDGCYSAILYSLVPIAREAHLLWCRLICNICTILTAGLPFCLPFSDRQFYSCFGETTHSWSLSTLPFLSVFWFCFVMSTLFQPLEHAPQTPRYLSESLVEQIFRFLIYLQYVYICTASCKYLFNNSILSIQKL